MDKNAKEYQDIVDEVCEKYGYDSEDKEGNDSLRTVLLGAIPAMLKSAKTEDRQVFYQMLRDTPIVVAENLTKEGHDKLIEQYIGNVNPHIIEEQESIGEYDKAVANVADGAYVSEPIIDENMQLQGKKSFVYMQKVTGKAKEFLGTDINVSHLIHELGHAWHSQMDEYTMEEDGTLTERAGTARFTYSLSKGEDGKVIKKREKVTNLMIEEAMNTIEEEKAMAEYMGLSLEEMREAYSDILGKSTYQGYMSNVMEYTLQELPREDFENWRMYGSLESKEKIEESMRKTEYWQNREQDVLPNSDSPRSYDNKRRVISKMQNPKIHGFFRENESVYFPDISQMSPLDKIDNVLEQSYTMYFAKNGIEIENYTELLDCMGWEGYSLINQTADVIAKEQLLNVVTDVRVSEINEIVGQTKEEMQPAIDEKTEEKGENR